MLTYDSGADGHYISEKDQRKAGLPILRTSTRKAGVANGGTSKANSVYDLPSTKQAIKWMHAVCGYPVKATWLKAIKAGNYLG